MVKVKILPDKEHASEEVAQRMHDLIVEKPNAVIGVATGSTPELAYALLADKIKEHNTDVSQLQFLPWMSTSGCPGPTQSPITRSLPARLPNRWE